MMLTESVPPLRKTKVEDVERTMIGTLIRDHRRRLIDADNPLVYERPRKSTGSRSLFYNI